MADREEILKDPNEIEVVDWFELTEGEYDEFDAKCWNKGNGYNTPTFPVFEEKIEGLEMGMYLFAGESNSGKSALMLNMVHDICMHPDNKLVGLYISLDDSKEEIIPRIIAMNKMIPIGAVSKPSRYQEKIDNFEENCATYESWLTKRQQGLEELKAAKYNIKIVDGTQIKNGEQLYDFIKKFQIYVKAHDEEADIVVAIDSLMDIAFDEKNFRSEKEINDHIAKQIKKWAVEDFKIPIFGSVHLRKLNGNKRPTLDDLKESGRYVYEASTVFLIHNDVSKNGQSANIYYDEEDVSDKQPILEIHWAKNKKSSYKGKTYCYFATNYSKVTECSEEIMRRYDALIYET